MRQFALLLVTATLSLAQQQIPPVHSPEVHADGSVTFRFRDSNAKNVAVVLEGAKAPLPMQRGSDGVWSATTALLAPEIYGYSFDADGVHLLDPSNTRIKPNLLSLSNEVLVPGRTPEPWEVTDIPHGIIHHHFYKSQIIGDNRDFYVYTPPGYDNNTQTRYPVLYLLHGFSDDASAWTSVGRANLILDSLIQEGKARPMIIVMPLGYGAPEILHAGGLGNPGLRERNYDNFRAALLQEVIPRVEERYRVIGNREARAIAGLSMGGAESLFTGLNRLADFSWIGSFSAGGLGSDLPAIFPNISAADNAKIHLLWIACGTDDRLITNNRDIVAFLKGKGVRLTQVETPGMHTWMVWRANLVAFAPLLFQTAETASSK